MSTRRRPLRARPDPDELLRRPRRPRRAGGGRHRSGRRRRRRCGSSSRGSARAARRSSITHGHFDHLGGVADLAEGTGAPVYMPEGERDRARAAPRVRARRRRRPRRTRPTICSTGGETIDVGGIAFECVSIPGHSPAHVAFSADGASSQRRPALRRLGRPRRPPGRRLGHAARLGPHARRALSARDGRLPGPRARDDARRELERNPFLAELRA